MKRQLAFGLCFTAFASASVVLAAPTAITIGVDRTTSPWQICAFDGSNLCQPFLMIPPTGGHPYVPVTAGGTGALTLSGILQGNGTNAISTAPTTGTGNVVLGTNPSIASPTISGTVGGTAIIPNGALITDPTNASNIVSGTLGVSRLPAFTGGDATTTAGSGSILLNTVNSAPGVIGASTAIPVLTTDGKGRVITQSAAAVVAPAGTLTGSALASNITSAPGLPYSGLASGAPLATTSTPGLTKPDGSSILVSSGTISVPAATTSTAGIAAFGTGAGTAAQGNDTRFPASVTGLRYGGGAGGSDTAATPAQIAQALGGLAGLLKGNGSSALSAAGATDVISTLGYAPINKAGDTATGQLGAPSFLASNYLTANSNTTPPVLNIHTPNNDGFYASAGHAAIDVCSVIQPSCAAGQGYTSVAINMTSVQASAAETALGINVTANSGNGATGGTNSFKNAIGISEEVGSSAGQVWNIASSQVFNSGWSVSGFFGANTELDITNAAGDAGIGTGNIYNLYLSGAFGGYAITSEIGISTNATGSNYASHFGLLVSSANAVKDAVIRDASNASNTISSSGTHTAVFYDSSTAGNSLLISGTYSGAAIDFTGAIENASFGSVIKLADGQSISNSTYGSYITHAGGGAGAGCWYHSYGVTTEQSFCDNGTFKTNGSITEASTTLIATTTSFTNGAGSSTATLTNGPTAGNPTKWIPVNDNGTTRYIPAW